ncbi:MAG TPA: UDP-N-acetylglucosamine 2-epimerase (non-hydrolyzing) [Gaiella sp.]|jgi:UDP-N-acetylglucosamine 2-epimerase (non-hydrolysing)
MFDHHAISSGLQSETRKRPRASRLVVPIVVGTRPEAIKLVPIILRLRESEHYEPLVVSTGQHHRMVAYIFELAGITPDVVLWAGSKRAHLNERIASVVRRFDDFCTERFDVHSDHPAGPEEILNGRFPAAVLVHGDTTSAMAAALSAFHLHIPVLHVEAGLRTGGNNRTPFPEELNRQLISSIAGLHFAPTSKNLQNLVRENVPIGQIFVTGNTGIDALQWASKIDVRFANQELQELYDSDRRIVVVTAHRRESWGAGLTGIAEGIRRLATEVPDVSVVLPLHPNPRVRDALTERLSGVDNVLLTEPLGYATFARLLARSYFVITDSGGIQEEAPSLGKPVLVVREMTERGEGIEAGTLRLVGTDPELIFLEGMRLLTDPIAYADMAEAPNPYGDGMAADRIVRALEHVLLGGEPPQQFGPGYSRAEVVRASGLEVPVPTSLVEPEPTVDFEDDPSPLV